MWSFNEITIYPITREDVCSEFFLGECLLEDGDVLAALPSTDAGKVQFQSHSIEHPWKKYFNLNPKNRLTNI